MTLLWIGVVAWAIGEVRQWQFRYRGHPDRVAYLADMEGRYPLWGRLRK
jgi:hypothetical protein